MTETLGLSLEIVRRNWAVYRKDFIANISPTIADPAFILLSLGLGLSPYITQIEGLTYAQFLAPGLIATTALFTSFFECSYGFYVRLTYESVFRAMLTTPIGPREVLLGEFIWVALKGALMAFGVGSVLYIAGVISSPYSLPLLGLVGGVIAVPCGAMGLLATTFVRNINQFQTVYSFLISPMYFLSGVFFPATNAHPFFRIAIEFSPFYHGVRLMQMAAWSRGDWRECLYHLGILLIFTLILGFWAAKRVRRLLVS